MRRFLAVLATLFCGYLCATRFAAWRTESWWFAAMGHEEVLRAMVAARWLTFIAGTVLWLAPLALTLRAVFTAPPGSPVPPRRLLGRFVVVAALLAVGGGLWMSAQWQLFLLFNSAAAGRPDPVFGLDLGFWLFRLPVYNFLWLYGFFGLLASAAFAAVAYSYTRDLDLDGPELVISPRSIRYAAAMAMAIVLYNALGLRLYALGTLVSERAAGADYTDLHLRLPLIWAGLAVAAATIGYLRRARRGAGMALLGKALGGYIALSVIVGYVVPTLYENLRVLPHRQTLEAPYLARARAATLAAYALDDIQVWSSPAPTAANLAATARGLPLWPGAAVRAWLQAREMTTDRAAFRDEALTPRVGTLHLDSYDVGGETRPVYAAAIEPAKATRSASDFWTQRHIENTHGEGIELRDAGLANSAGVPRALPQAYSLLHPELYFSVFPEYPPMDALGFSDLGYRAETKTKSFTVPLMPETYTEYVVFGAATAEAGSSRPPAQTPPTGVPIASAWRRLLLAIRFTDFRLLTGSGISYSDRLAWHRHVGDRCRSLAPFLQFSDDPMPVVANRRAFWLLDGFTSSNTYPYSQHLPGGGRPNYLRDAVTATVDAFDGTVRMYLVDKTDPISAAWSRRFPKLFLPLASMPAALRAHLHYSPPLLQAQALMLTRWGGSGAPNAALAEPDNDLSGDAGLPSIPSFAVLPFPEARPALATIWPLAVPAVRPGQAAANANERPLAGCLLADRNYQPGAARPGDGCGQLWLWRPAVPVASLTASEARIGREPVLAALEKGARPGGRLTARGDVFAPFGDALLWGGNATRGGVQPAAGVDQDDAIRSIGLLRLNKTFLMWADRPAWVGNDLKGALARASLVAHH